VERGNAFITPEWFFAWLGHVGGAEPHVMAVSDETGTVVGVVPLVRSKVHALQVIRFPSTFGDIFHPACALGLEHEVARAVGRAMNLRPLELLVLTRAGTESDWTSELAGASSPRLLSVSRGRSPLPSIDLTGTTWESYLSSRTANFRQQVRRKLRSLKRRHVVEFRRVECDPASVEPAVASFFALYDKRWPNGETSLSNPQARRLLLDFAVEAAGLGWLRLWFLELDGEPVAGWYGWRIGERYSYYQAGFDPARARDSVGFLLMARTIEAAFDEGASTYDLLLGDETYKSRLATGARVADSVVLARRPMRTVLATLARLGRLPPPA
jgi:CelD/BcsL family acetyltransferase involved in cellulose biosynthesis